MNFLKNFEIQGQRVPMNSLGRSQTVPNCIEGRKGKGVMDILMDAPNCHQRAHAGSSASSKDQLSLNGFLLLPTSRENGNNKLQSFLVPNHPCNPVMDLSPNKHSVSLYNMTSGTAATRAMVAPPTPVSMEKNKCGNLKEYIPREIIDLNSEIPMNPLEDCIPNGVQPSQVVTSLNVETEADNLVNVDPSECSEREKQDTYLNRALSQKPRRKKHRPKVIMEEKVAKTPKKIILETTENSRVKRTHVRKPKDDNPLQSPGKRKYTRKKKEVNPQPNPGCVLGEQNVTDQNNFCRNPSVKRSLNFDLNEKQTKKLNTQVNAASEAVKDVLSTQIPPATHSLTNENVNEKEDNPLQSPGKGKYTKKKKEVNPQPNPGCVLGEQNVADQNNFCMNPSVKQSLNFDLNEKQTKKLNNQINAASEAVKYVLSTQIPPATHSLTNENVNEKEDNPLQSPGKSKYTRKNKEANPQPYPGCVLGEQNITDLNIFFWNPSVMRSLNFDLNKRQTIKLNTQVNEASKAVKDVLNTQIPPATHSSTDENVNEKVRAPETPSQHQQLSRLELAKRKRREEFDSLGFNTKSRKEGENLNRDDKEIVYPNTDRNKDKNVEDGQALSKGRKRDHNDVDDGCVHMNTSGVLCLCDIMKKRKKEYKQSKVLSDSCSILPHTPNSWRNVQNSNKISMTADERKFSNHVLTVNYVKKDSAEIILSRNRLSCPGKSSIQDNTGCSQTPASRVVPENVRCGAKARAEALTAYQSKPKSSKRKRKEHNQLVSSIAEDTKRMELIMEYIVSKLACLNINGVHENVMNEPGNALVPFVGGGVMVPYSGPPEVRKTKKPRAKVNLDAESERVWNLLMGKESDVGEGTDADIEKWWENERHIFLGRTASFTARMHLIQGNRKFSPWKGSVVDSVIGVFLTQNVSDHLSSSAFMSLAARFPIRSNSSNTATNVKTPAGPIVTEPNIHDQNLPGICDSHQQSNRELSYSTESSFSDRGVGYHDSPDTVLGLTVTSCADTVEGEEDKIRPVEDVISLLSSNSFTSFTQLLNMANSRALCATNVMGNKSSDEYGGGIDWPTLLRSNEILNPSKEPDLTNPEPSNNNESRKKNKKSEAEKAAEYDWDSLRRQVFENGFSTERNCDATDSMDYTALRNADVSEISKAIRERGMNNILAERIKAFLDRLARDHGSVDLEWLRHVSPDRAKEYLLSINGLGLKSVECIRLLTLHQLAFPVDTNVARISVRLGWVPLQPLPESLQLHLLEMYPMMENIQKYLWPRLCKLDQAMLYELHYQLITFGKVFCTKSKPNCNACPMRAECRHFASAYASARLALPGPEEKRIVNSNIPLCSEQRNAPIPDTLLFPQLMGPTESQMKINTTRNYEPIIEEPSSPEPESVETAIHDIEDDYYNDTDEMPTIKLNFKEFAENLQSYMHENGMQLQDENFSNALVAISREAASLPSPKLKNVSRLRTEHQVYELPDGHPLLDGLDNREPDDPCKYLIAIWAPGETAESTEAPKSCCDFQESGKMCGMDTCFSCNSKREADSQTVRGTILIPCRTANRGSFPLNGTYFQVNEVFADHASSRYPIDVPREWIWELKRRTVYFGTSTPSIFKGLAMDEIQQCFCRGYVCVRGFDRSTRAPKPLYARLHFPASKVTRTKKAPAAVKTEEAASTANTEQ